MTKFTFRLATVLRLRETTRDQRRVELAETFRQDDALRDALESLASEIDAVQQQWRRAAGPGDVDVKQLIEAQRYEALLRNQRADLLRQREAVQLEIERRRQTLVEADREVRALENLRDRQTRQHDEQEQRREVARLDEVAHQRAAVA